MNIDDIPVEFKNGLIPSHKPKMVYECIECENIYDIEQFLYTCPKCGGLLRLKDLNFDDLKRIPGKVWQKIFGFRRCLSIDALKGIFLYHELILPIIPLEDVIYLGEGYTPIVKANLELSSWVGTEFFIKYDGLNPSASFKDRGMASAISFINYMIKKKDIKELLGICASTGDTSAAAAIYLSYLPKDRVKSVVLLPEGKVTPAQLSQPLGAGAKVIEIPGVFDDCMKIVEELAENYDVCLLNSKNPIRINGQRSYSYEIAQQMDFDTKNLLVVVPIGNAGNITAIMEGFLNLYWLDIIEELPFILGVQSEHADPVVKWREDDRYQPVKVKPSVAQAAMIGNPVSFPKIYHLVKEHFEDHFFAIRVTEQEIMDGMITANRHGHVVCTQGGESIAGLKKAIEKKIIKDDMKAVVDSTSHQLKFSGFQQLYFENGFSKEYEISPKEELINKPEKMPANAKSIADYLGLKKKAKS
ncbi:MAG: threonine synthase [Deltaproteobacteria bacterium]|nr:MAG: threonine synthase [Deltaproteobacteria bacterium]